MMCESFGRSLPCADQHGGTLRRRLSDFRFIESCLGRFRTESFARVLACPVCVSTPLRPDPVTVGPAARTPGQPSSPKP